MRPNYRLALFLALCLAPFSNAAVSLPAESSVLATETSGPAAEALEAFQDGRHVKAVELAKPLADQGNADALYLMGFAHETGQGIEASREMALGYYRKAADLQHKDAIYRLSFILLASEDATERDQAREQLEKAAQDDPAVAGRILGEAYLRGLLGDEPDYDKTIFWWQRASDAGDIPSILLKARLHDGQFGFSDKTDPEKAIEAFGKAAGLGNPAAMVAIGSRLLNGPENFRNEEKGREWLKKAIEEKEFSAYLALGDFEENVRNDPKAALAEYERGKDAGQIDCILRAAEFYLEGIGTDKDVSRAMNLLENAARSGSPIAHFRLAAHKLSGDAPDAAAGYGHLLSAANGGLIEAQNELGLLYLSGRLAVADVPAAVAWFTRAAQAGSPQAQNNLAALYEQGAGVPQNFENAGQLYALAANQGHPAATLALARFHANGMGTEQNLPKAWALASLAAERGDENAPGILEEITALLDDAQKEEARTTLEEIKSGKPAAAASDD